MSTQGLQNRQVQQPVFDPICSDSEDEALTAEAFGEFLQNLAQLHINAQLPTNDNHKFLYLAQQSITSQKKQQIMDRIHIDDVICIVT